MKAMILARGFGTRLRPITLKTPKPMIRIRGKPFLEYLLNYLRSQDIREYILCLHYMYKEVMEYFGDGSQFGVDISYIVEDRPMGDRGALKRLKSLFRVLS
jgi:NDP-sugar pyrophosphorylase family protein